MPLLCLTPLWSTCPFRSYRPSLPPGGWAEPSQTKPHFTLWRGHFSLSSSCQSFLLLWWQYQRPSCPTHYPLLWCHCRISWWCWAHLWPCHKSLKKNNGGCTCESFQYCSLCEWPSFIWNTRSCTRADELKTLRGPFSHHWQRLLISVLSLPSPILWIDFWRWRWTALSWTPELGALLIELAIYSWAILYRLWLYHLG